MKPVFDKESNINESCLLSYLGSKPKQEKTEQTAVQGGMQWDFGKPVAPKAE